MDTARVRREGVAVVLCGRLLRAWRDGGCQWCAHSSCLVSAKLKFGSSWMHIASCYAPTFAASRDEKDCFFEELRRFILSLDEDELVLLGYFNARVGTRGSEAMDCWSHVRGPHGLGVLNDAGEELLSFLSLVGGTVCNTWFQHKDVHKATWRHPRSGRWHCIDFFITRQRDLKRCLDVRVVRGADCSTDHLLLGVSYLLPSSGKRRHAKIVKRQRFYVAKLLLVSEDAPPSADGTKVRIATLYNQKVFSTLPSTWSSACTVVEKWKALRSAIMDAAVGTPGYQRRCRPDWYHAAMDELELLLERRNTLF